LRLLVRRTVVPDIAHVAKNMRPEDIAEIKAGADEEPMRALMHGYLASDECYTIAAGDEPLGIFGFKVIEKGVYASVWMLGTTELVRHRWAFLRQCRAWVEYMQDHAPLLYNIVDQRNDVHIAWLKWMGFKFVRVIPDHGHERRPFVEFVRTKPCAD
jgi:hypothetical protein